MSVQVSQEPRTLICTTRLVESSKTFCCDVSCACGSHTAVAAYQPCKHFGTGDCVTNVARPNSVQLFASRTRTPARFALSGPSPPQMTDDNTTPSSSSCTEIRTPSDGLQWLEWMDGVQNLGWQF